MEQRRKPNLDIVREVLHEEDERVREEPVPEEPVEDDTDDGERDDEAGA